MRDSTVRSRACGQRCPQAREHLDRQFWFGLEAHRLRNTGCSTPILIRKPMLPCCAVGAGCLGTAQARRTAPSAGLCREGQSVGGDDTTTGYSLLQNQ
jgi:hypothetical protein